MKLKNLIIFTITICLSQFTFGQVTVYMQPGSVEGIDARVQSNLPNANIGNSHVIAAQSGTMGGNPFLDRSMIRFDLSFIPEGATITSVKLSLYANTGNGGHKNLSGNSAWIERITESWG